MRLPALSRAARRGIGRAGLALLGAGQAATLARGGLHWDQEMALLPWLVRQGWVLYRDFKDQHPPLLTEALALLPTPGDPGQELVLTIALVLLTTLLTALLAYRLRGVLAAAGAVVCYALWLLVFDGAHLWYDLALGPFYLGAALLGLAVVRDGASSRRTLVLGVLLGCAVLVKQQAVVALAAGLPLVVGGAAPAIRSRRLALYMAGAGAPLLGSLLAFAAVGALGDYLYWAGLYNLTSDYATAGAGPVPPAEWPLLAATYAPLLALAALAILPAIIARQRPRLAPWPAALFAAGLLLAATLPAWPRYARFHLAGALPLLAVAAGLGGAQLLDRARLATWPGRIGWAAGLLILALALYGTMPAGACQARSIWQAPPAPAPFSPTIGPLRAWLAANAPATDGVFLYDLDSTLYRALERVPPRPWSPVFPWILEGDSTADQWVAGLEAAQPRVVLVSAPFAAGGGVPLADGGRSAAYLRAHYRPGPHFQVQKYPDSGLQEIVALVWAGP